ncbi:MAG TPA: hypothetical protein VMH02_09840, partial [Verrucomicrobiae bacterium]|nr:hypothetical protein [Verrucomicrobiae bacterium]
GTAGGTAAIAGQFIRSTDPAVQPTFFPLENTTPQQLHYVANSNGSGTEFQVIFRRAIFSPISTPSPGATNPPLARTWLFNAFVTQANAGNQLVFVDSMGRGGPTDTTYTDQPPLQVCQSFDTVYTKVQDVYPPPDPAAQIAGVEIANNGSSPPSCPP